MNGIKPEGRRVGLLSQHQIWAFLLDRFCLNLSCHIHISPSSGEQVRDLFEFYGNSDSKSKAELRSDYNEFSARYGVWQHCQANDPTLTNKYPNDDADIAIKNQSNLTIKEVIDWVDSTKTSIASIVLVSGCTKQLYS